MKMLTLAGGRLGYGIRAGAAVLAAATLAWGSGAGAADWNQWRGPNRDAHSPDKNLRREWPASGPALAWKVTGIGAGYSGVSVMGDRVLTMGDVGERCVLIALDRASGKQAWAAPVGKTGGGGGYPGPRCTPATDGALVFALGQEGDLVCARFASGEVVWRKNFPSDFGGKMMSGWGYAESPLLDGDQVVVTPGGPKGTVLALDKKTGATLWQSAELTDNASYASLVPVTIGAVRQYVVFTDASVAGVAAKDGKLLWRAERRGRTAVVPTPVCKDNMIFVTSGYNIGCNGFKVTGAAGRFSVEQVYAGTQMRNHHGGVILVGDHVYGFDEGTLKCIELASGRTVWEDKSVGKGSVGYADGHLYARSERGAGTIALIEATPAGYREKSRFDQPNRSGKNSWPHPVIVGGRLYIRDQDLLLCYDVAGK